MDLGRIGIWAPGHLVGDDGPEAARLVERLGYGTFWVGASPRLKDLRPLLEATASLTVATGIVNVWAYEPEDLAAEYWDLERDFPGRFLVGIGIGHPEATKDYKRPLASMCSFLDGLDAAADPLPSDRRCIGALGPKMLELSRERSLGSIPYFVPLQHTVTAREELGPEPLLAPEVAFSLAPHQKAGRAEARAYAAYYLGLGNYTKALLRTGFTEDDLKDGGSDRLIDAVVPHGGPETIAKVVRAHLDAGANHVALQPVGEPGLPRAGWTAMAEALSLTPR